MQKFPAGKFHFEPPFTSFDHLVGAGEQRRRHLKAERLGGPNIDYQLEFGRLYNWQVGCLFALENAADIDTHLTTHVRKIGPVAHQTTSFDNLTIRISGRNPVTRRQGRKLDAAAVEERVGGDEKGVEPFAHKDCEGRIDLVVAARVEHLTLQPDGACSFRYVS